MYGAIMISNSILVVMECGGRVVERVKLVMMVVLVQ